jgi:hypothetical protein
MIEKNEVLEIEKEYIAVVKEYYIITPRKNLTVYGRITKFTNGDHIVYGGSFSHFCLPSKIAPEYAWEDDNIVVNDYEQAEVRVRMVLEDFTDEFGTKKNKFFKN